ncbi:MAG: efflux RND transporter periplasmic adaptor subunit [Flavobacteriales bacterium]|nr:efflux RND transporter periplasmic adaptor subunit [Flavobacteriales bacterium]
MKKYLIYTSLLLVGLLLGWLIFSNSSNNETETEHKHSESEEQIWTCSMHPQIRQPEPGDCPICGMDLIPLEENSNENPLVFSMSDEAVKIANIQTTKIGETGNSENGIALSGKIKPDETASSSVVTHVSGRIEKLYVSYTGQSVAKGQKVAEIYSPQLISAQKELIEANKVKSSNPSLYKAAYNKLKNWKLNDNQIESILKSESIIETFSIYAQFSGVIKTKKVSVGDYLKEGEVLFDLQSLSKVWAVFDVYETDIANVKIGDPIEFTTTSYPDEKFTAKVNFIDPLINPSTRTISVRANIQNNNSKLKPDMFINGWVKGSPNQKATLLVPKSAVLWTGKRSVVYLKLPNQTVPSFEYRNIEIGEAIGDSYKVISGLESGDEVVTNGAFVIDASAQLNNQSSMMNQNLVNPKDNYTSSEIPDYVDQTDEKFKVQLNELLSSYYNLKDAFVNDKADLANSEAKNLLKSLDKVEMKLLKGDAHMYWMTQKNNIQLSGEKIANSNDINEQRNQFISISSAMINSVKAFGVINVSYEQYCPMADDNNGAYWLSESNKVLNPYFGSSMLNCGEIKNEIK